MTCGQQLLTDIHSWLSKNDKNFIRIFYDGTYCPIITRNEDVPHDFITYILPTYSMYDVAFCYYVEYNWNKHLQYFFEMDKLVGIQFGFTTANGSNYMYKVVLNDNIRIRIMAPYTNIPVKIYEPTNDSCILYEYVTNFIKTNNTFNLNELLINDYFADIMRLETLIHRLNDYAPTSEDIVIEI